MNLNRLTGFNILVIVLVALGVLGNLGAWSCAWCIERASKHSPGAAMILPPPPSQPVPAPVVPVVAPEPSPALGIDCALFTHDPDRWHLLRSRARWLSARYYGAPVFLVGSAVTSPTPRDIDVVIVLPADLFVLVYGDGRDTLRDFRSGADRDDPPMIWRRWARDCAKQGEAWTREVNRAVDFKVLPDNDAVTISDKPRVLLAHVGADRL